VAITVNNTQTGSATATTTVTLSNYNVGVGTAGRRKLVVFYQAETSLVSAATGITYGGVALTEAAAVDQDPNFGSVWYLDDVDIGVGSQTEDIVATAEDTFNSCGIIAIWADDITQGVPTQTVTASQTASATSFSATINSVAADAIVFNNGGVGTGSAMTADGGQTLISSLIVATHGHGAAYEIPGSGNHTQGWTFPSSTRPNIVLVEWAEFVASSIPVFVKHYRNQGFM